MSSPSSTKPGIRQHRPMARLAAALVAVAATAVALTACGASVSGSPQPNAAAVTSAESTTTSADATTTSADATTTRSTPTSDEESTTSRASRPTVPTDLTDLSELTELSELTDVSIPTDLGEIPGFSGECAAVSIAYLAVVFAPLAALDSSGTYNSADLQKSLDELNASAEIPAELAPDFQALTEIAQQANGQSIEQAGELFGSEKFTTASDNISTWVDANCAG